MKKLATAAIVAILAAAILTGIGAGFGSNKPAAYRVVAARTASQLSAEVSQAMAEGWVPLGQASSKSDNEIMQTMLRY